MAQWNYLGLCHLPQNNAILKKCYQLFWVTNTSKNSLPQPAGVEQEDSHVGGSRDRICDYAKTGCELPQFTQAEFLWRYSKPNDVTSM